MSSFAGPWDPGSGQKSETARGRGIISVRNTASSQLSKAAFPSSLLSLPAPSADAQCSSTPASSPRSGPKRGWPVTHTSRRRRGQPSARRLPRGSGCGFPAPCHFMLRFTLERGTQRPADLVLTCPWSRRPLSPGPSASHFGSRVAGTRRRCSRGHAHHRGFPLESHATPVSGQTEGLGANPGVAASLCAFAWFVAFTATYARLDGKPVPGASRLRGVHSSPTVLASISRAFPFPKASHQQPR